jgi:hypothetical protein
MNGRNGGRITLGNSHDASEGAALFPELQVEIPKTLGENFYMRVLGLVALCVALASCAKSPAELEVADDANCRKIIAERNDTRPNAYEDCRAHLADYRRTRAIEVSGDTVVVRR